MNVRSKKALPERETEPPNPTGYRALDRLVGPAVLRMAVAPRPPRPFSPPEGPPQVDGGPDS